MADAGRAGAAVYLAPQELFDRIAGFHVHRGALGLGRRPPPRSIPDVVAAARLLLVVEGVNDHENLGSLFRNGAAFGVGGVVLDPSSADPLYRRSVRVSVGHVLRVPFARAASWPGDLAHLRSAGVTVVALDPAGEQTVDEIEAAPGARLALLVGAEGHGLTPGAREAADLRVRIPMAPGVDSLNVATAAAVALHRVARSRGALDRGGGPRVSS